MRTLQAIDVLINDLPRILDDGSPGDLVKWCKEYASEGESVNYGAGGQKDSVSRIFMEHGIAGEQHSALQQRDALRGESARIWAEFIAGQLLKFSLHPRYFVSVARVFSRIHGTGDSE